MKEAIIMSASTMTNINIYVNNDIKNKAQDIFTALGLDMASAVNIFLRQTIHKNGIPFELSSVQLTENGYTPNFEAEILAEAEACYASVANGTAKIHKNTAEMFAAWDEEDDD